MKLIFELGVEGRGMTLMPECDVPEYQLPEERSEALHLPHVSENELTRHYTALCKRIHGVNDGFYPLGSCTMKYNPKIDEDMAALPGFTQLHPLQPIETAQGALEALHTLGSELGEVFGMDAVTFQPAAGAALYAAVERFAREAGAVRIASEVSETARGFFERQGFRVDAKQRRRAGRLELTNYRMSKALEPFCGSGETDELHIL